MKTGNEKSLDRSPPGATVFLEVFRDRDMVGDRKKRSQIPAHDGVKGGLWKIVLDTIPLQDMQLDWEADESFLLTLG